MAHRCCRSAALRCLLGSRPPPSSSSANAITNPLFFAAQGLRHRKLEVILTTTIPKLGKAGETVKVAPGHFRNYLMPKMLAVPNIHKYAFLIREQRKLYQREEDEVEEGVLMTEAGEEKDEVSDENAKELKKKEYQAAANRLVKTKLVLRRFVKDADELRKPVDKDEIVAEIERQLCVKIHPDNLHLPSPLQSLGEYELPLLLPRDIPRPEGIARWRLNMKIRRK